MTTIFKTLGDMERDYYQNATAPYSSLVAKGTQTAPVGGTAIATLTAPAAGYYAVYVTVGFGGTAEDTAVDNFRLKANNAAVIQPVVANTANAVGTLPVLYINANGTNDFEVIAVASASVGAVYKAHIIANRLS